MQKKIRILKNHRWNPEMLRVMRLAAKAEGMGVSEMLEKAFVLYYDAVSKMNRAEREKLDEKTRLFFEGKGISSKE